MEYSSYTFTVYDYYVVCMYLVHVCNMYMVHVNVCRHYFLFSLRARVTDGLYPPTDGYMFDILNDE